MEGFKWAMVIGVMLLLLPTVLPIVLTPLQEASNAIQQDSGIDVHPQIAVIETLSNKWWGVINSLTPLIILALLIVGYTSRNRAE